ncbi:MAG: hypothetical protein KME07_19675 [Pegethrix bostrychoides GSE-TBD4-15B]|jgi:hypothetical protein|uniref:Uncharacterized protein n=1 Tax=Pegethrix bostrychoides GSE-TBD4-15B TaxID=2839662 RepID=A0A951PE31_9CYAN|nr:hypothetical protein [Pegethrix bostrychoides GSE-TBD4-15B]
MSQEPVASSSKSSSEPESQPKSKSSSTPPSQQRSPFRALLNLLGQLGGILLAFVPLIWKTTLALLRWLSRQWAALLPKLRPILPPPLRNLPDALLTAMAIGLLALSIWLSIWIPTALLGHESAGARQPAPVTAPAIPKPDRDQARLSQIQAEIAEALTQQAEPYGADLVQAVQANFNQKQLTVSLAERWYGLTSAERRQVAELLLKQAKKQGFRQVEVTDPNGVTVARPAVVGSGMVILVET